MTVTDKMIEIAAKAMAAADSGPEGSALFDIHWREFGESYLSGARVALEAARQTNLRFRHKKRGSEYEVIGVGHMQSEMWEERGEGTIDRPSPIESVDMREVTIYRSVEDGSLWVRPIEEFNDGRFEPISTKEVLP